MVEEPMFALTVPREEPLGAKRKTRNQDPSYKAKAGLLDFRTTGLNKDRYYKLPEYDDDDDHSLHH